MGNAPNSKVSNNASVAGATVGKAPFHYHNHRVVSNQRTHAIRAGAYRHYTAQAEHSPVVYNEQPWHTTVYPGRKQPVFQVPVSPRTMSYLKQLSFEQQQQFLQLSYEQRQQFVNAQAAQFVNTQAAQFVNAPRAAQFVNAPQAAQFVNAQPAPKVLRPNVVGQHHTPAMYSVIMSGSEDLVTTLTETYKPTTQAVQHTAFSCTNEADFLCISPTPLNESGVVSLSPQEVYSYCSQRNQMMPSQFSFTGASVTQW